MARDALRLLVLLVVLGLSGPGWARQVTFHTQPEGARVYLENSGQSGGDYLGRSGQPLELDLARFEGQTSFDVRFEAEGLPPLIVTLRPEFFLQHDHYPERGVVLLDDSGWPKWPWGLLVLLAVAAWRWRGRKLETDPLVGASLGPYRLGSRLGSGGGGNVYRAEGPAGRVAVKVAVADQLDPGARQRFAREIENFSRLEHPGILRLLDRGEQGELLYLVTELQEANLRARMGAPMAYQEAVAIVLELLGPLQALHRAGLVHRDLKPENVLLGRDGLVLADLGLAGEHRTSGFSSTRGGLGTLGYAAPEQLSGEQTDARTDQYSLGVVFFELLTGRLPFPTRGAEAVVAHLTSAPPRPSDFAQGLPEGLDQVVVRMLAKVPARRFEDLSQVGQALEALA
ncbi:MAG: serine/threonine-protein kinase [Vulcanimicrobiota bacterium]